VRTILQRAIARQELSTDTNVEVAIDLLQGPLFLRLICTHSPLEDSFADALAEMATTGLLPRTAAT
jgi:hypothetical protein